MNFLYFAVFDLLISLALLEHAFASQIETYEANVTLSSEVSFKNITDITKDCGHLAICFRSVISLALYLKKRLMSIDRSRRCTRW